MQEESDLFNVKFNEEGKKFIRKFAAISYAMLVLVVFDALIALFWSVKMLVTYQDRFFSTTYNKALPFISIGFSILSIVSNIYYLRFPRALLRSLNLNDELGANRAFKILYRGASIFLVYLLLNSINTIWSITGY